MDTTKKISFGFNKLNRKANILLNKEPAKQENSKVQLIEYLEEQSIKVIGDENNKPVGPLIIPMKAPNKNLINLVDIVKNDFKDTIEENKEKTADNADTRDEKTLTLDELAAKELINGTCNKNTKLDITKVIEVSATDKVTFDGEKESSLDDYESVPVDQFGKAMLRGMGWKDGEGIGKNQQLVKVAQPVIRPKGMGLGADSLTKKTTDTPAAVDRNGKALTCVKGAHVKVIAGYHKGYYGQIMGFDDESGRFIIKLTLSNINVSLNEFLVTPVTKQDYEKNSKVLNNAKYEEYLKHKEHKEEYTKHKEQKEEYTKHKEHKEEYTKHKEHKEEYSKHKEQKHNTKQRTEKQVKTEPEERTETEIKKEQSYSSNDEQHSKKKDTKVKKEQDNDNSARKEVKKEKEHDQRTQNHEDSRRKHREGKHKSKERSKHNKDKNAKKNDRYSTSESEAEDKRTNKYDSSDEYERNRTARRNSNNRKTKKTSRKHKSDEEYDNKQERRTHSNRRYSDSESEDRKKRNSEEYERKSRKHSRNKRYDSTDTESEERYDKKQHKKEKYRDRSKHSTKDKRK